MDRVVRSMGFRKPVRELAPSGYVASVDRDKCKACGVCAMKCPFGAVSIRDESALIDPEACMGCGVCTDLCPQEAIALQKDPARGTPLDLGELGCQIRA